MSVQQEISVEMRRLRQRLPGVAGSLVASLDGLPIASDLDTRHTDTLAALAATGLALGQRVSTTVGYGELTETVVTALGGYVGIYAAGPRALLAVLAPGPVNLALLHVEAREVAGRVAAVIEVLDVAGGLDPTGDEDRTDADDPAVPPPADGSGPAGEGSPAPDRSPAGGSAPPGARTREGPWPEGEPLPRRDALPRREVLPRRSGLPRRGDVAPQEEPDIRFTDQPVAPMPRRTPPSQR